MTRAMTITIHTLDTNQFGQVHSGAAYLLQTPVPALIESGTAASHNTLLDALRDIEPAYLFLTHIHLDHAGGAGHVARVFPDCKIVVHARGAPHLADPTRLIDGVRSASPDLFPLYGTPTPIPARQLVPVSGGERFDLGGGAVLDVIATPGHASHHICFHEPSSRVLFVGDAVGHWQARPNVPLTVPPRFDRADSLRTLRTLRSLHPGRLAFTHFGIADHAASHLARYEAEVDEWFAHISQHLASHGPTNVVDAVLAAPSYADLSPTERDEAAMCVRGAVATLQREQTDRARR